MIAIIRNVDNRVINDRQGSDFPDAKKVKLAGWQEELEVTPWTEPQKRKDLRQAIDKLQGEWDAWLLRRREICAQKYGGVASDYSTVQVPPESEAEFIMQARYIEYDGENLTFDTRPAYTIDGSVITCTAGWVRMNDSLLEDDITDFSSLSLTEPLYFQLWYAQNNATQEITVQLLTRKEDEEFSPLPGNLTARDQRPICQGRVNADNSINIGEF